MRVTSTTNTAYKPDNDFKITFNPDHEIPRNGFIEVAFPKEVIIPDTSYSASQCLTDTQSAFGADGDPIVCEFSNHYHDFYGNKNLDDQYKTLRIYNGFRTNAGLPKRDYSFTIPGITNPIRVGPTPFFRFSTFTRDKKSVDMSKPGTGGQLIMKIEAKMTDI